MAKAVINIQLVRLGLARSIDCEHGTGMDLFAPVSTTHPAKRYTKKPRQPFVSSSLDPLAMSAAVTRVFVC